MICFMCIFNIIYYHSLFRLIPGGNPTLATVTFVYVDERHSCFRFFFLAFVSLVRLRNLHFEKVQPFFGSVVVVRSMNPAMPFFPVLRLFFYCCPELLISELSCPAAQFFVLLPSSIQKGVSTKYGLVRFQVTLS